MQSTACIHTRTEVTFCLMTGHCFHSLSSLLAVTHKITVLRLCLDDSDVLSFQKTAALVDNTVQTEVLTVLTIRHR